MELCDQVVSTQPQAASGEHIVIWTEYKSLIMEGLRGLVPASYYLVGLFMVSQVRMTTQRATLRVILCEQRGVIRSHMGTSHPSATLQ